MLSAETVNEGFQKKPLKRLEEAVRVPLNWCGSTDSLRLFSSSVNKLRLTQQVFVFGEVGGVWMPLPKTLVKLRAANRCHCAFLGDH